MSGKRTPKTRGRIPRRASLIITLFTLLFAAFLIFYTPETGMPGLLFWNPQHGAESIAPDAVAFPPRPTGESPTSDNVSADGSIDLQAGVPDSDASPAAAVSARPQLAGSASVDSNAGSAADSGAGSGADSVANRLVSSELVATELLSRDAQGNPADRAITGIALSADAQTVAFATRAGNLEPDNLPPGDAGLDARNELANRRYEQVYVLDRAQNRLELITLGIDGLPGNGWSSAPALSPDGRFLAFYSWAANLVADDTNAVQDAFLYDRRTQQMTRVSVSSAGRQGNDRSGDSRAAVSPALSADGRWVAFHSSATNLIDNFAHPPGEIHGTQVYLHDLTNRTTELISSPTAAGTPAGTEPATLTSGEAIHPALSADGRFVVFQSTADYSANRLNPESSQPGLSMGEQRPQIWLLDRNHDELTLVSRATDSTGTDSTGTDSIGPIPADGESTWPAISADGTTIAFQSTAGNLTVANGAETQTGPAIQGIYVYDRTAQSEAGSDVESNAPAIERISVNSMGIAGNGPSSRPALSLDGRYIAFASEADNLVGDDYNRAADIFIHDRQTRHTSRVSVGVSGVWSGFEANGPATGPPAPGAQGRWVAFVAQADNLLLSGQTDAAPADHQLQDTLPAQAYLHERRAPVAYSVAGRVVDPAGRPIAHATVRAGAHHVQTGVDGRYRFPGLVGGTYALTVEHAGYSFSPPRRITSVLDHTEHADFTGFVTGAFVTGSFVTGDFSGGPSAWLQSGSAGDGPRPFLDLPLAYDGRPATFLQALRDTSEGGLVDAWFDHAFPYYSKTGSILLWDGRERTLGHYNDELGCYENRCYDGHDGIDFPYRAHLVDRALGGIAIPILPAAPGRVVQIVDTCHQADRWCNRGYGNEVILDHENGYFTRYSHLDRIDVGRGQSVTRANRLGLMGNTGNSYGIHLHFAVHRDNGNGRWDGDAIDLPVDPFGWTGNRPDPWVVERGGPVSHRLWLYHPTAETVLVGAMGGVVRDGAGAIAVQIPGNAFQGQARFELAPDAPEGAPPAGSRSIGRAFRLQILDWLSPDPGHTWTLDAPMTLQIGLDGLDLRHLDLERLALYRWTPGARAPVSLPTTLDLDQGTVTATSDQLGNFDLQAPLLCPQDRWEPDDSYFAAIPLERNAPHLNRLLDVPTDEDWFRIEVAPDTPYTATLGGFGPGVLPILTLVDRDGVTELEQVQAQPDTTRMTLSWSVADQETVLYLQIRPQPDSFTGCEARYSIRISTDS